jgi:hypothetical protein
MWIESAERALVKFYAIPSAAFVRCTCGVLVHWPDGETDHFKERSMTHSESQRILFVSERFSKAYCLSPFPGTTACCTGTTKSDRSGSTCSYVGPDTRMSVSHVFFVLLSLQASPYGLPRQAGTNTRSAETQELHLQSTRSNVGRQTAPQVVA